jgi:hypothetical protein
MTFEVELVLENPGRDETKVVVPQGMVFENVDPRSRVQNLLAARPYTFVVPAGSTVTVVVDAYCANSSLSPPKNATMRVTTFATIPTLSSQRDAWDYFNARMQANV